MAAIFSKSQLQTLETAPCKTADQPMSRGEAIAQLTELPDWRLGNDGKSIARRYEAQNFLAALTFFEKIGSVAEENHHHPDLHLVRYREVTVSLWTHSIGGLSRNDFIVAAKIDAIP
ncbi:MAG: 4a-hydroxytetrahydrobiopterin dehydratase, partial [Pirellulaceae bacterium]|nr:4a-hydroxytetrahydrobiopterin dehydratase [Pirellulaceae bacterium]